MEDEKYNVYKIDSTLCYYGISLVAAKDADEANDFIQEFKREDFSNTLDSKGYSYVDETDVLEDVYSERKGIIMYGIRYFG